ncbi:MAG TPA: methyltransferase domain-containing protein [Acidimicrobiales bacterium]|nr:methyltransferase domain-containing protein [Acidimicrobiales bacterium]
MTESDVPKLDRWATWLTQGRDAGLSEAQRRATAGSLAHLAERVVDGADMSSGDRVLDVGAGTGLLSVPAATRVGPTGVAIALDLSGDALDECRRTVSDAPLAAVVGDALSLPFAEGAFAAALTRSVLIYVRDKAGALEELHRVLAPRGRLSAWEPINRAREDYGVEELADPSMLGADFERVRAHQYARWEARDAMVGFDERDLVRWCLAAGFEQVSLRYDLDYSCEPVAAEVLDNRLRGRPNPSMPSLHEAAVAVLGDGAYEFLERYRQVLMSQPSKMLRAVGHLTAKRA